MNAYFVNIANMLISIARLAEPLFTVLIGTLIKQRIRMLSLMNSERILLCVLLLTLRAGKKLCRKIFASMLFF